MGSIVEGSHELTISTMARKISNLIILDRLFSPIYQACAWVFPLLTPNKCQANKVLAIKFFGMGSIVRIGSVLKESEFPISNIELITLSKNKKVCELLKVKAHFIRSENPFYLTIDLINTVLRVWKMKETKIIDLERTSNLSGIFRLICGIGKSCVSFTFEERNKKDNSHRFISLNNKPAIDAIAEVFETDKIIPVTTEVKRGGNKIVINVNAGEYLPQRRYPIHYFAEIVKQLKQEDDSLEFVLTGSKKEVAYTNLLATLLEEQKLPFENTAGKLSLAQLMELLKTSQLLITNDSGPLHLAYYFDVPTVAIWGPTSSKLVGYPDSPRMKNVSTEKECSPCFIHPKSKVAHVCSNRIDCLQELDPSNVIKSSLAVLHSHKTAVNVG